MILSFIFQLGFPEVPADRGERAVITAVVGNGEKTVFESFVDERFYLVIVYLRVSFLEPSGNLVVVGGGPPIILLASLLHPFVVGDSLYLLCPQVLSPFQPISL